ncbi:tail fiber domain-containing protein [Staphylococcus sp. GDY8P193P]|uniref:tail fiber domain-containing protein n=1 Tax=Staphylococcus sp. GDY8P193P TaxID=2804171 RepID=UPI001AEC08E5|nr:tail fiber domain-containing protein [Staphylococcus sp. GDY8P193P]
MYYTDFPIDIGQEYRYKTINNFKWLLKKIKNIDEVIDKHKTTDAHAHNAKQIDYKLTTVHNELHYQRQQLINLVLGANGNGVQELRDSRTSLDGTNFQLLSDRLKYDLEVLNKKIDDGIEYIKSYYSYYINIQSIGAIGDGQTDNTELFNNFKNEQVYFVPKGTYKTNDFPNGLYFGYGQLKVNDEIVPIDNKLAQPVNVDYNTPNKERYYSFVAGQDAGKNQTKESYANTGIGYAVFRNNVGGRRLTAFGKGAMDNMFNGYSNDAFGADALGQGTFGQRNTALGANALKWGGVTDAVKTLHDFWKDKGDKNFVNSYFLPRYPQVWSFLGSEEGPNDNLYPKKESDYINNVGVGRNALVHLMKGVGNVAVGYNSQSHTIKGSENTSMGNRALRDNLLGVRNTAIGSYASVNNISGVDNVSLGSNTLQQTLHASNNTSIGYGSMHFFKDDKNKNTNDTYIHGYRNTAVGTQTMQDGKNASYSTFVGSYAGRYVEGNYNVGLGASALYNLIRGEQNVALGGNAGRTIVEGSNNVALGYTAGPNADYSNTVSLGANSHANGDNQVQLGSAESTVYAHKEVQQRSDRRDKNSIRETELGLDFIQKLKPVDYKYNNSNSERFHHGFIAQDLENLKDEGYHFGGVDNPKYKGGEDVYSVGYTEIIAPLVKSVQELSEEVNNLRRENNYLKGKIDGGKK